MRLVSLFVLFSIINAGAQSQDDLDDFLVAINELRQTGCHCGSPTTPLSYSSMLHTSAKAYASDMARFNYFSHTDRKGGDVVDRIEKSGYDWQVVGENLGTGQTTVKEVMHDWVESKSHCQMMMSPKFDEIGLGRQGNIWVLHLGKQVKKPNQP